MRLRLAIDNPAALRKPLALLLALRKLCVFRFSKNALTIISSALNEPQVWTKLDESIFQMFEVESARDNVIPFEINIDPLYEVLKNYEKSTVTSNLSIRLQRKPPTEESNGARNKAAASLALFYTEQVSMSSVVNHSFNIPVRLLRMESDQRIQEPSIDTMSMAMKLPAKLGPLFKRIERYKMSESIKIIGNRLGQLQFVIDEGERRVEIQWKEPLEVSMGDELTQDSVSGHGTPATSSGASAPRSSSRGEDLTPIVLKTKLRYWKIGCRLIELCEAMSLIIHSSGCILHCYIDPEQKCDITYYMGGYYEE